MKYHLRSTPWPFTLLALLAALLLAACSGQDTPTPQQQPSPTQAATPFAAQPTPTLPAPTRVSSPDFTLPLENRLGTEWQRAEIAWSPDGHNLAITYWAGWRAQTFLLDARTGETADLVTDDGLETGLVAWSPDGKRLAAIAGNDMDTERLGVWLFAGGRKLRLLDGACEDLAWSPDGATLLATCELYYWGSSPPPLDQSPGALKRASQQGGVWGGGQLWRIQAQAGDQAPQRLLDLVQLPLVTFGAGTRFDTARNAIWSPDGQQVAFEVRSEDKALALKMGIATVNADGSSPRLLSSKPVWLVGWLPDGKLLVRSNVFAGQIAQYTDDLFALDPATGLVENLTRVDPYCDPLQNTRCQGARRQILNTPGYAALSPDKRRYYYGATGRSDVTGSQSNQDWLVVGTYPPSDLVMEYSTNYQDPAGERLLYPAWLADGRLAHVQTTGYDPQAGAAPQGSLTVRLLINGKIVRQEEVGTWEAFGVGWSPDGSRVALATDFGVLIYGLP